MKVGTKLSSRIKRHHLLLARLLIGLGLVVLVVGVFEVHSDIASNSAADAKAAKLIYQANHNINHIVPSTNPVTPSAFDSYTVGANYPRYIFIPKIAVKAIVRAVGLTSGGQIGTPDNVFDTAWYNKSALPGASGATIIDGHVSSWTTNGVFYNLKKLTTGDNIQIELGNGSMVNYSVAKVETYNYQNVDMTTVLSPISPNKPGLNLITCSGDVIKGTNEFNERIVVYAQET